MRVFLVACLAITSLTASCSDADPPSESDDNATSRSDAGERRFVDAGTSGARPDASTAADAGPGDNEGNGGEDSLDEGCAATTLDEGVACQIAANDAYVAAFCDCFTASAYAGDRAACEAEQPNASDFAIPACPRAALMAYEEESTAHAVCYAAAVEELAECMAQCPGDQEAFDACTAPLGPAFDACDTLLPEPLVYALGQCEEPGGPVGPGDGDGSSGDGGADGSRPDDPSGSGTVSPPAADGELGSALAQLRVQRDDWVETYCTCYGAVEYGTMGACRDAMQRSWDPGLSACEAEAFGADLSAGVPFVECLRDTFLIGETACLDCPSAMSVEWSMCSDPSFDVQFCFLEAPPALQTALMACTGGGA